MVRGRLFSLLIYRNSKLSCNCQLARKGINSPVASQVFEAPLAKKRGAIRKSKKTNSGAVRWCHTKQHKLTVRHETPFQYWRFCGMLWHCVDSCCHTVSPLGAGCRRFKSSRPDQSFQPLTQLPSPLSPSRFRFPCQFNKVQFDTSEHFDQVT